MADQDWSIKIVTSSGTVQFQPDVPGAKPGDPLQAGNADIVSWNNRTGQEHWPWAIDPTTGEPFETVADAKAASLYLSDEVSAWQSSEPAYLCAAPKSGETTLKYICRNHPDETGEIIISATA